MLEKSKRERIIALVNKEVVPAIGCTEPMAVALCTAKAATTPPGARGKPIHIYRFASCTGDLFFKDLIIKCLENKK